MPKRIIHGEGLWRSDKLARVTPPKYRAEYANLVPLALVNGVFEVNPSRVWAEVYAFNRPEISRDTVVAILKQFEDVGLLFRWTDAAGKAWGYWTGIDKPGRLPPESMRKHYECGPEPPAELLGAYLSKHNGDSQPIAPAQAPEQRRKPTKTPLSDDFAISDAVRKWAKEHGYTDLEKHLEHFKGAAKARGYRYADWEAAFQNAIRDNWAKVEKKPQAPNLLERHNAAIRSEL